MTKMDESTVDKQLAHSVKFGRRVTLLTPGLEQKSITGYVSGFDRNDIRLLVIEEDAQGNRFLVTKTRRRYFIAGIDFDPESTRRLEPQVADDLADALWSFKNWVLKKYFSNNDSQ